MTQFKTQPKQPKQDKAIGAIAELTPQQLLTIHGAGADRRGSVLTPVLS